jgi:hypothetical protein
MQPNDEPSAEPMTLLLDQAEVLALYSFLTLGAHFSATISGDESPLSPDELRGHIATIGQKASNTLMDKLAEAVAIIRGHCR